MYYITHIQVRNDIKYALFVTIILSLLKKKYILKLFEELEDESESAVDGFVVIFMQEFLNRKKKYSNFLFFF